LLICAFGHKACVACLRDYLGKDVQKGVPIGIIIEDVFAPVAARSDVVQRAWKLDPDGRDMATQR
jgi:hypothetical protein